MPGAEAWEMGDSHVQNSGERESHLSSWFLHMAAEMRPQERQAQRKVVRDVGRGPKTEVGEPKEQVRAGVTSPSELPTWPPAV